MASKEPSCNAGEVIDLMTPNIVSVKPDTKIGEIWRLMTERRFRHMPVAKDDGRLLGIVSQRDLLIAGRGSLAQDNRPVSEVMKRNIDTTRPNACAAEAARHRLRSKRSGLPVVDAHGIVVGILTEADFLRLATRGAPPCTCGGVQAADTSHA